MNDLAIEIKDGQHEGELGVILEKSKDGVRKVLTLEGAIHFYDEKGYEIKEHQAGEAVKRNTVADPELGME